MLIIFEVKSSGKHKVTALRNMQLQAVSFCCKKWIVYVDYFINKVNIRWVKLFCTYVPFFLLQQKPVVKPDSLTPHWTDNELKMFTEGQRACHEKSKIWIIKGQNCLTFTASFAKPMVHDFNAIFRLPPIELKDTLLDVHCHRLQPPNSHEACTGNWYTKLKF